MGYFESWLPWKFHLPYLWPLRTSIVTFYRKNNLWPPQLRARASVFLWTACGGVDPGFGSKGDLGPSPSKAHAHAKDARHESRYENCFYYEILSFPPKFSERVAHKRFINWNLQLYVTCSEDIGGKITAFLSCMDFSITQNIYSINNIESD